MMAEASEEQLEVIDFHCHIASLDIIPPSFMKGAVSNLVAALDARGLGGGAATLESMFSRKLRDPHCDELVTEMDEAGIGMSVLLAADFSYVLSDVALTVEESILCHREVLQRHPGRFVAFAGVDPRWGKDGIDLFERSITEYGFSGFKVYPPCGFSPSDSMLDPYYELCAHHQIPALVHIGPTSPALAFDTAMPILIDEAARRFPTVDFVLAHGAVSYPEDCVRLCRFRPNIFLDISGYQGTKDAVRSIVSQGINHKILFGTDWPVYRLQGTQSDFLRHVLVDSELFEECTEEEAALILAGNAKRLLGKAAVRD